MSFEAVESYADLGMYLRSRLRAVASSVSPTYPAGQGRTSPGGAPSINDETAARLSEDILGPRDAFAMGLTVLNEV